MIRAVGRALAAVALGSLVGPASLVFFYALESRLDLTLDQDPPALVSGLHPVERDEASGLTFAWTGADATIRLPGLDRRLEWVLDARLRGARPDGRNPALSISADGVALGTFQTGPAFERVTVTVPIGSERRRGLVLTLHASTTFVPGPADTRALGLMLDELSLTPSGVPLPPRRAFAGAALAPAALGGAVALLGVTAGSAIGAAVFLCAGTGAMLARGFAPYTDYPLQAAQAAFWIGLALSLIPFVLERSRRQPLRNTARFAAAFTAGTLFLKWLVIFHPNMPIGDALFHAHRFQGVLAGKLYFTSIAPGNYLFPYAPGLYVFAAPFAGLVERGNADMALLRTIALAVDAVAASLLYVAVVHAWRERTTAALAVALYQLIPLEFTILSGGTLTNTFAQSLSVVVLVLFAEAWVLWERRWTVVLLTSALTAAFLSHTSTFAILMATSVFVAAALRWRGTPPLASGARAVLAAAVCAAILSVAIYYGHFGDTYRAEFARIGQETATGAADAGGRGIGTRAAAVPMYLRIYFGPPTLLLTLVGAWRLSRSGSLDRLVRTAAGWIAACVVFLAIGVLTPVDMRYYLASIPALAVVAAAGASALWSQGLPARAAGAVLLAWCISTGVTTWWHTLD